MPPLQRKPRRVQVTGSSVQTLPKAKRGPFNPGGAKARSDSLYLGKAKKVKEQLIHKAKVKKSFYKSIAKDDPGNAAPEYIKEIFGEQTVADDDGDGNVKRLAKQLAKRIDNDNDNDNINNNKKKKKSDAPAKTPKGPYGDQDENGSSSADCGDEDVDDDKRSLDNGRFRRGRKPDPLTRAAISSASQIDAAHEIRKDQENTIEESRRKREQYYEKRNKIRSKVLSRTRRGQPVMGKQMEVLLGKIQGTLKVEKKDEKREKRRLWRQEKRRREQGGGDLVK